MADLLFAGASSGTIEADAYILSDAIATPGDFKTVQVKVDASVQTGKGFVKVLRSVEGSQFDSLEAAPGLGRFDLARDKPWILSYVIDTRGVSHIKLLFVSDCDNDLTLSGVI